MNFNMELVREGLEMWDENFDYIHQDKNGQYSCDKSSPKSIIELTNYLNYQNKIDDETSDLLFGNQEEEDAAELFGLKR